MAYLTPSPKMQFLDANGNPMVGGKLYTYAAGTTTPLATYTDYSGGTPNTNPVILDSRGEASVWIGTALYYMELKSSTGVLQWSADNVGGYATLAALAASSGAALIGANDGSSGSIFTTVQGFITKILSSVGSSIVGFIQSGTGAVARTMQDKGRESINVKDFGAVGDGVTDDTATVLAAITYVATNGYELVFPQGTYKGNWVVPTNTSIIGESRGKVVFIPAVNAPVFSISTTVSTVRLRFEHFTITGDTSFTSQTGIDLAPAAASTFCDTVLINDVSISSCGKYGIHTFGSSSAGPFVQNLRIDNTYVAGCVQEGVYGEGEGYEWLFTNVWVTNCGSSTIPTVTFGSKTSAGHAQNRVTWIAGGINHATIAASQRYVTDLVTTAASANVSSATAAFTSADVGKYIAIHNGNTVSHPLITTIASVTDANNAVLSVVAGVSNAGGTKAIINLDYAGAVYIHHAKQVKFIGCDFESAGSFFVVDGSNQQNLSIDTCRFGSNYPVLATIWSPGIGGSDIEYLNCREGGTSGYFYTYLTTGTNGAINAVASQTKNVNVSGTTGDAQLANMVMYDLQAISSNTLKVYQPYIGLIRVSGAGTLNYLYDSVGGVLRLNRGSTYTLLAINGFTVNPYSTPGNIVTTTGAAVVLAAGASIRVVWDEASNLWYQI